MKKILVAALLAFATNVFAEEAKPADAKGDAKAADKTAKKGKKDEKKGDKKDDAAKPAEGDAAKK